MPQTSKEKKVIETRALIAARNAGVPIPLGESPGEEPDFRFKGNKLGIEVSELMKPASSNFGILPAEAESYHEEILQMAEQQYYSSAHATPLKIILYFANTRGERRDKRKMARALADFVRANVPQPDEILNFSNLELPKGFGSMSIRAEPGQWWCGESGSYSASDIQEALASRIRAKSTLVPTYRRNLALGARIWLVLYSTFAVSRGMEIPYGIKQWQFDYDFDRVFWFTTLGNKFVEIQPAGFAEEGRILA